MIATGRRKFYLLAGVLVLTASLSIGIAFWNNNANAGAGVGAVSTVQTLDTPSGMAPVATATNTAPATATASPLPTAPVMLANVQLAAPEAGAQMWTGTARALNVRSMSDDDYGAVISGTGTLVADTTDNQWVIVGRVNAGFFEANRAFLVWDTRDLPAGEILSAYVTFSRAMTFANGEYSFHAGEWSTAEASPRDWLYWASPPIQSFDPALVLSRTGSSIHISIPASAVTPGDLTRLVLRHSEDTEPLTWASEQIIEISRDVVLTVYYRPGGQ